MAEYNREQLMGALKKADAAGDENAARAIARKIKSLDSASMETSPMETQPTAQEPTMSQGEAFTAGAVQGASFGFSDEAIAATETGKQVMLGAVEALMNQGMSGVPAALSNITEDYNKNLKSEREYLQIAQSTYPYTYAAGDIAGSLASGLATTGLGTAIHGAKLMKTAGATLGTAMSVGFAHGIGRSENETIAGMLHEGIEGAKMGFIGEVGGPALIKGAQTVGKNISQKIMDKVSPSSFVKFLGGVAHDVEDSLQSVGKPIKDWTYRMLNYVDEEQEPLIKLFDSRKVMADKVHIAKNKAGAEMGSILSKIDNDLKLEIDPQLMHNDIYSSVIEPLLDTTNPDQIKAANRAALYLKNTFFDAVEEINTIDPKTGTPVNTVKLANKKLTLKNLHAQRSQILNDSRLINQSKDIKLIKEQDIKVAIARRIGDHIDTVIEGSGKEIKQDLMGPYSQARLKYGDLSEASNVMEIRLNEDRGKNLIQKMFRDGFVQFTSAAGMMGAMAGIPFSKVALAGAGLKMIYESPNLNGIVVKSAKLLHETMNKNPDAYQSIAAKLISAAGVSSDAFIDELSSASSQVDLLSNPLQRTSSEVLRRKDAILSLVHSLDPDIAESLRSAIEKRDDASIRDIMSKVNATTPSGLIQEGIGWDGIAVTEDDKVKINTLINSIKNSRKRMYLSAKFNKDFVVPKELFQGEPDPATHFIYRAAKEKFKKPKI